MFQDSPSKHRHSTSLLCIVACVLLISLTVKSQETAAIPSAVDGNEKLKSVADMIVVSDGNGTVVYVADNVSGAIFYLKRANDEAGSLKFSDFELLVKTSPEFPKPSGLAYRQGKLIGCDPHANGIFKIDLSNKGSLKAKPIPYKGTLNNPEHIAVSETGMIVIGSDKQIQYLLPGKEELGTIMKEASDIDRLTFDGGNLIALDEAGSGNLYSFSVQSIPWFYQIFSLIYTPKVLPDDLKSQLPDIQDFTSYRGVYYALLGEGKVVAFSRPQFKVSSEKTQPSAATGIAALPVPLPENSGAKVSKIAASENSVYMVDVDKQVISSVARPVPIVIDFPNASESATSEQLRIYERMISDGTLLRMSIPARTTYESVNDFVLKELIVEPQQIPVQPNNPGTAVYTPGRTPATPVSALSQMSVTALNTLSQMSQLICKLNKWDCEVVQNVLVFKKLSKIGKGNNVIVPAAATKGYLVDKVNKATDAQIDFESYLVERGVIPLSTQSKSLSPGEIVSIFHGHQAEPDVLGRCNMQDVGTVISSPTFFPNEVEISPYGLARQLNPQISGLDLQRLGVERVMAKYTDVRFEKLGLPVWEKSKACSVVVSDQSPYVVDRVLLAQSASYKFLDGKGKPVPIDPKKMESLFPSSEPDPAEQGGWTVRTRLNLGYIALRFKTDVSQEIIRLDYFKPSIATSRVRAQRLTLLVESKKLPDVIQTLTTLAGSSAQKFYTASAQDQELKIKGLSFGSNGAPPDHASNIPNESKKKLTLKDALAKRDLLRQIIHFPQALSDIDLGGIRVGIVEKLDSIEDYHHCFSSDKGEPAFDDEIIIAPREKKESSVKCPNAGEVKDAFDPKKEHGTHVAAIIAARRVLPGMVPSVRLVRIDPTQLVNSMEKAEVGNVGVFNFSIELPGSEYQDIISRLKTGHIGQHNLLLVVAAGNETRDYGESGSNPTPPVVWLRDLYNNVIVVGAATNSAKPQKLSSTNYSKKFVHLFAPAEDVYSATNCDTYAPASGSSQAAPQVTAVAAMLSAKGLRGPWIKAVLIYTADWRQDIMDEVWGGILNAERAIEITSGNKIWFDKKGPASPIKLFKNGEFKIKIKRGARINDPNWKGKMEVLQPLTKDTELLFDNVLRVERQENGLYRVIYIDVEEKGVMKMLVNAEIEGGIRCVLPKNADGKPDLNDVCRNFLEDSETEGKIGFEQMQDYIRMHGSGPKLVKFSPPN